MVLLQCVSATHASNSTFLLPKRRKSPVPFPRVNKHPYPLFSPSAYRARDGLGQLHRLGGHPVPGFQRQVQAPALNHFQGLVIFSIGG